MRQHRLSLLAEMARARRTRFEPDPWIPTEEEKTAIAEGTLIVFPIKGGPLIWIDLRAAALKP